MTTLVCLLVSLVSAPAGEVVGDVASDTLRLRVGSPEVDGRVFPNHLARNRTYIGKGAGATFELVQTYGARSLAPLTYHRWSSDGSSLRLRIEGTRIRGEQRAPGAAPRPIDRTIDRPAFFAGASDLVPMAVTLEPGLVITAPVWSPGMDATETSVFSVIGRERVRVEDADVEAWRVEEHVEGGGRHVATWYLTDSSPFMVLGEMALPDGRRQRITGVALDGPGS